ncbi:MAG TPA: CDP-alcohol phosphatidyltransferase family protein [Gemmatimonadaceae bacterium]|nr:CDP-alcohol phosphatidyltransferase family protein [Gemmatimonadaceae bacterium]
MNLPNAITIGRILIAPLIAALPFINSPVARAAAFVIYIVAAVSDYFDGMLARTRNLVTDLGRLLDPLADKLLLFATLIPMYVLMAPQTDLLAPTRESLGGAHGFAFRTPWGQVGLPFWIVVIVLGRELFMTAFRQVAARRGVVIGAIGPAKWKTGFQSVWVGAAFFWFFAATLAERSGWNNDLWQYFEWFNAAVGISTMIAALFLTIYSLVLYVRRYGGVLNPNGS